MSRVVDYEIQAADVERANRRRPVRPATDLSGGFGTR